MAFSILRPVRRATHALLASDSPRQLAAGFALGMVLGFMPKGNLIALSLCVLVFSLRVNTGMAIFAAIVCSWIGPLMDPFANKLGMTALSASSLQPAYAGVFSLPLGPWLGMNNTAVVGALLLGLYLAYPVYWLSYTILNYIRPRNTPWSERARSSRTIAGN